ncbi:MAG: orotate phosphoribosyltransferase [Flavobacterium sp.]
MRDITVALSELVPEDIEVLAGLEMGGIPIVTPLSQMRGLHCASIRKEAKSHGTCDYSEGAALDGRNVLLVEDVVSSARAIIDFANRLRGNGINIDRVICVLDRETGGFEKLHKEGIGRFL